MTRSRAYSAQYSVECPKCHAAPNDPCRTFKTGRVTNTHLARIDAAYPTPKPVVLIDSEVRVRDNHTWTLEERVQHPDDTLKVGDEVTALEIESRRRWSARVFMKGRWDHDFEYVELEVDWKNGRTPE